MSATKAPKPRRGRPNSLTYEQIVAAALRLVADRRLEDVSMREIAAELGVPITTLYGYVANKEQLGTLVVDHILREVPVPGPEQGSWHERIRIPERSARQTLAHHGGLTLRSGVLSGEAARLADGVVEILTSSGFDHEQARRAFVVLYTFMIGQVQVDSLLGAPGGSGEPTLEGIAGDAHRTLDELFEFGFDVVVTGLEAHLRNQER